MVVSLEKIPAPRRRQALLKAWQGMNWESCPEYYNFHLHSVCSDGSLQPVEVLEQARTLGVKGLTLTDHHTTAGFEALQPLIQPGDPQIWSGVEITADLIGVEVHILGYDFDPQHPALEPYLQGDAVSGAMATDVIKTLHQAGGLAVLAHPSRYSRSAEELVRAAARRGIDGIEVYYAYKNPFPWAPTPDRTELAESLAREHRLYRTGGTDTHGLDITRRI